MSSVDDDELSVPGVPARASRIGGFRKPLGLAMLSPRPIERVHFCFNT